jgi:hypothetical protein
VRIDLEGCFSDDAGRMDFSALDDDGLILFNRVRNRIDDSFALRREVARGKLVALRRGAFVESRLWAETSKRDQHLLRARAVVAATGRPVALCGISAAAAWGMPIAGEWPIEVSVLDAWKGGGRSEPGVRSTSAGFASARIETLNGLPVTSLARTALDVARLHSFADAVGSVDWALWRRNEMAISSAELFEELSLLAPRTGRRHLARITGFGTSLSDSFEESRGRAIIHLLGFAQPELQVEFRDSQGLMMPDYFWRSVRQAAEFDGKSKYTRDQFTGGDPGEVVWREKKREDRLRKLVLGVTRILTSDVSHPPRLARLLLEAGVPRGGDNRSRTD